MTDDAVKVANSNDVQADGDRILINVDGLEIAIFRSGNDLFAVSNYCVHQLGPVCEGRLIGQYSSGEDGDAWTYDESEKAVTCPWHGWMFDIESGELLSDDQYRLPTYEVFESDGDVYLKR
jgi:nitrite reductase/ring-hydroxylating ferredoxin subunit